MKLDTVGDCQKQKELKGWIKVSKMNKSADTVKQYKLEKKRPKRKILSVIAYSQYVI